MGKVEQAAREAAADVLDAVIGSSYSADLIRNGEYDEHGVVGRIQEAILAEREACAKVAELVQSSALTNDGHGQRIAEHIRSRTDKEGV